MRSSANLLAGGDADPAGAKGHNLLPWRAAHGSAAIRLSTIGLPDSIARGSGNFVFTSGRGPECGLQQADRFSHDWRQAISNGRTKLTLAARLGSEGERSGVATARITFLGVDGRDLGSPTSISVSARERHDPALMDVSSVSIIPTGTITARIDLLFLGGEQGASGQWRTISA